MPSTSLDTLSINTLRFLSADAVQNANSGHPGLPMGAAPMAYVLWTRLLRHNPADPTWPDRDRFVLSGGHGSMLLYSLLHLTGYDLPLDELKNFRQLTSRTPGHPECHITPGVEVTTGPLGQGLANAVGMAAAEAHLAAHFNRPGHAIVNHYTYVIASDGDLMEGVTAEACALAGHLRLGKLIVLWDDNRISLAGTTNLTFTEDVRARFTAYGWHVAAVTDGNDVDAIEAALRAAQAETERPSLIAVCTTIGYGAPNKAGSFEAHGNPLGPDELKAAKANLGWPSQDMFYLPGEAVAHFRQALERGREAQAAWQQRFDAYAQAEPTLAAEFQRRFAGTLPEAWDAGLPTFPADPKGVATRKASEKVMQALGRAVPELFGGSADLNPSTFTVLKGEGDFQPAAHEPDHVEGESGGVWSYAGRNIHYGVREHAMGSMSNGIAAHGGLIPYTATFLIFSDYMRPAIRLAALSRLGTVFVFTHDSIGLGEDGPTHQPIEHHAALRAIPRLLYVRPADANETAWAWQIAIANREAPTVLALTRQNVPVLDRQRFASAEGTRQGAYVLNPEVTDPSLILMATGSEVALIVEAEKTLAELGLRVRLVSMPCWELFTEQPAAYRDSVLPPSVTARVAIEAGVSLGWRQWVGDRGAIVALDDFGASAPGKALFEKFGITAAAVVERGLALVERS